VKKVKRIGYHVLFWVVAVGILTIFFGKESDRIQDTLILVLLLLPIAILTSYLFNYLLIPRYLFQKRFFQFVLYSVFLVTLSIYLEMLIVLGSFIFQANYQIDRMIPGSTNAINLGVGMYFIVFLSILVYLVKRWSQPSQSETEEFLNIRSDRRQVRLPLSQVIYVESLDNYVKVKTPDKEYMTKERISNLEQKLNGRFLRIHRSFLVNKEHIESFTLENLTIKGEELPISRTYKKDVMEKLTTDK
jgi:hypothetical protein